MPASARTTTRSSSPASRRRAARPGRPLHGMRRPLLPQRLPAGQPHPRLERPRLPRPLAGGDRPAARHQQLPRLHRPAVPRAVRGGVRAGDPRGRRRHDQADRARHHRPRLPRRAGSSPSRPRRETGQSVAVVGSGPAGMAAAQQLRRAGHARHPVRARRGRRRAGALRRARLQDREARRAAARRAAARRGRRAALRRRRRRATSPCRSCASASTRSCSPPARASRATCPCPAASWAAIHFAMDYLYQRNRWVARRVRPRADRPQPRTAGEPISAAGKHVVVIGGGDTGADCVGNSLREGALSIVQLELLPEPPPHRPDERTPWPQWPLKYRLSYAMEEARDGRSGRAGLLGRPPPTSPATSTGRSRRCTSPRPSPRRRSRRSPGTERELPAQLVLLAMGFLHPEQGCSTSSASRRTRAATSRPSPPYTTSVDGVFAAGDARRGQSLIVWAINEGRQCARMVDRYLAGGARPERRPALRRRRGPRRPRRRRRGARGAAPARRARVVPAEQQSGPRR